MKKPSISAHILLLGLLIVAFAISAFAQSNKGAILGTVKDPNDALVAKAQVKITSVKTGEVRTAETSDDGTFTVTNLEPGTYNVTGSTSIIGGVVAEIYGYDVVFLASLGFLAAAFILLIAFGSVLAMGLPLATAAFGIMMVLTGIAFALSRRISSATSYGSRAATRMSMQCPSDVMSRSRTWSAASLSAGVTEGAAATSRRTASSRQEAPSGRNPARTATAAPAATTRTRAVTRATARPRPRGRGSDAAVLCPSGKL